MARKTAASSGGSSKRGGGGAAARSQFKRGHKPHNAPPADDINGLEDLIIRVGSEPKKVLLKGEVREISRAERALRLTADRAMEGRVRAVATILRCMIKYPQMSKSFKEETVFVIAGTDRFA